MVLINSNNIAACFTAATAAEVCLCLWFFPPFQSIHQEREGRQNSQTFYATYMDFLYPVPLLYRVINYKPQLCQLVLFISGQITHICERNMLSLFFGFFFSHKCGLHHNFERFVYFRPNYQIHESRVRTLFYDFFLLSQIWFVSYF